MSNNSTHGSHSRLCAARTAAVGATGALAIAFGAIAGPALAGQSAPKAAPKPKISATQAENAAVKKIGGKLVSSKYEFEDGRWQYAVLVNDKKGQMYEVEVNASTGRVMDTEKTSAAAEAREAVADKRAADKWAAALKSPSK